MISAQQCRTLLTHTIACAAWFSVCAFVLSDLLTDRVAALQSLWWTPRIWFVLGCTLLVSGYFGLRSRSNYARALGIGVFFLVVRQVALDWGLPKDRPTQGFRLVHWNASSPSPKSVELAVRALLSMDADAIVLTDPGSALRREQFEAFASAGFEIARAGRFALLSRTKVTEATPLIAGGGRNVSRFAVVALDRMLVIEAVDFPSDVKLPRGALAEATGRDLSRLRDTFPDIAVGDFNIPRGSDSLSVLYPAFRESFHESGVGWGMSYPRSFPCVHIDLALVGRGWKSARSEIVVPQVGRHAIQVVDLMPSTHTQD